MPLLSSWRKADRHEWISVVRDEAREDGSTEQIPVLALSMVTEKWWPVVTGNKNPNALVVRVFKAVRDMRF
jgi:hypothetical protein